MYLESLNTHHGGHDPADVDGVASVQVVFFFVPLVQRADLEQIQGSLQDTGLKLHRWRDRNELVTITFFPCSVLLDMCMQSQV